MRFQVLVLAAALALAAGCDRGQEPRVDRNAPPAASGGSSTTTTPANAGQPSMAEKKEGGNPVQGQVDPKAAEQHRDFQQKGDGAGPKSAETTPK
jgi:hypothetical protein